MSRSEIANNMFFSGYNCAQSVLYSFCEDLNIDKNIALKIACGFGAGMGRKQEVCGAISGGIMVLGMIYGKGENEDSEKIDKTYKKVWELIERFSQKYNTYICHELIDGCDLSTLEGQRQFKEKDYKNKVCKQCVIDVVEIIEEIIK